MKLNAKFAYSLCFLKKRMILRILSILTFFFKFSSKFNKIFKILVGISLVRNHTILFDYSQGSCSLYCLLRLWIWQKNVKEYYSRVEENQESVTKSINETTTTFNKIQISHELLIKKYVS